MNGLQLKNIIIKSFEHSLTEKKGYVSTEINHSTLSKIWIEQLAKSFREYYSNNNRIIVFSRNTNNKNDFGLNELLYDITIAEFDFTNSFQKGKIKFIKRPLWLIESEFAKDSKQAVKDFNKLVLGRAANNLFIGPETDTYKNEYEKVFTNPAKFIFGNIYIAFVPHPDQWGKPDKDARSVKIVQFDKKEKSWEVI